jgi:hypothetical protein
MRALLRRLGEVRGQFFPRFFKRTLLADCRGLDAPLSSLCDPKRVTKVGFAEMVRNLVPLPASSIKRGRGVVLEAPGLN